MRLLRNCFSHFRHPHFHCRRTCQHTIVITAHEASFLHIATHHRMHKTRATVPSPLLMLTANTIVHFHFARISALPSLAIATCMPHSHHYCHHRHHLHQLHVMSPACRIVVYVSSSHVAASPIHTRVTTSHHNLNVHQPQHHQRAMSPCNVSMLHHDVSVQST